jgi:hypothetical protein
VDRWMEEKGGRRGRSAVLNKTRALLAALSGRTLVRRKRRTVSDARMKKRARCRYFIGPVA